MSVEPPWKYMAGIDTSNVEDLRKFMVITQKAVVGIHAPELTEEESKVLEAMLAKTHNNNLLRKMTVKWASNFDQCDAKILEATKVLKRDATNFVLKPKLYMVEYKLAEEAFDKGGRVYMGKLVTWDEIPEEEKKAREKSLIAREKEAAVKEERLYVKSVEMKPKAVKKVQKVAYNESEEEEAGEEMDDFDDEKDKDYAPYVSKKPMTKRQHHRDLRKARK